MNYILLTPFYTRIFDRTEYGVITEFYAYVIFLMVILTYGMETGYFRFSDQHHNQKNVYRSSLSLLSVTSFTFIILAVLFSSGIAGIIGYNDHPEYVIYVAVIIGLDAFTAIPFSKLRLENRAIKYSLIRIIEVIINIGANWFFLFYCANHYSDSPLIQKIYDPEIGVGYVFISNLFSTGFKVLMLMGEIFFVGGKIELFMLKKIYQVQFSSTLIKN